MSFSPMRPPARRSVPHIVAPTMDSLRGDSAFLRDLSSEHAQLLQSSIRDDHDQDLGSGVLNYDTINGEECFSEIDAFPADYASSRKPLLHYQWQCIEQTASQIPAIVLVTLFHLMVGIPFGVSYFPIGWKSSSLLESSESSSGGEVDSNGLDGPFPIQGKEALGIRMFLFSTIIGQLVMTYSSNFNNCIALQMVENVPFTNALTRIVVEVQGYGREALSTLFFLFGLASVIVGLVFYILGRMELGRILYFFPAHVLVGCIGGIGVFIAKTGLEVTANTSFSLDIEGFTMFLHKFHLLALVFGFEVGLRFLTHWTKDDTGKPKFPLLSPIYFCLITPVFYGFAGISRWVWAKGLDAEYFFPPLAMGDNASSFFWDDSAFEIFYMINPTSISWSAVVKSIPTLIALVMFSLIHVPINIPAFAVSSNVDVDMNMELKAHGYSNGIAGLFGGLQNYMAYTQSIMYYKSGGSGKSSSLAVALLTTVLFIVGPSIASFMPRCMAGTLLLHCGMDLFIEGVYDSFGKYDIIEYTGILAIAFVMTLFGMEAALGAGAVSALLTYAIQSVAYPKPIRGEMTAATLRSSALNRSPSAFEILDNDETGRLRICVVQLQGHLFFGNVSLFSDGLKELIQRKPAEERPYVIIIDFTLVLGIDSSAALAIIKLRNSLTMNNGVELTIFVAGSYDGFPCEINLSFELNSQPTVNGDNDQRLLAKLSGSIVCEDLDSALACAEDYLIAKVNPDLLNDNIRLSFYDLTSQIHSIDEERSYVVKLLMRRCPGEERQLIERFATYLSREIYQEGAILWRQGAKSDCAKLLVSGDLVATLENEAGTWEAVSVGSVIGESGLVERQNRNSTVTARVESILYSLSLQSWESMKENDPKCANLLYAITVRYLMLRVQHCSNRIFETRCLPV